MPRKTGPASGITVQRHSPYLRGGSREPGRSSTASTRGTATATQSTDTTTGVNSAGTDLSELDVARSSDKSPRSDAHPNASVSVAHLNADKPITEIPDLFWKHSTGYMGKPSVPWAELPAFQDERQPSLTVIPPGVSRFQLRNDKFDLRDSTLRGRAIITAQRCLLEFLRRTAGGDTSAAEEATFHVRGIGKLRVLDISTPQDTTLLLEAMPLAFDGHAASYVGRGPRCSDHHATVRILGVDPNIRLPDFIMRLCETLALHGSPREAWDIELVDPLNVGQGAVFSGEIRVLVALEQNGAPSPAPRDTAFLMPGFMEWNGEHFELEYCGRRQHCEHCKSRADPHHERDKCEYKVCN